MLEETDEILLEEYITIENITNDIRDLCINLIRNIKEITCSEYKAHIYDSIKYDLFCMNLKKDEKNIIFNGNAINQNEIRFLIGRIERADENTYYVMTNFYRTNEYVDDNDCDLSTLDIFTIKDNVILRETHYKNCDTIYVEQLESFDENELYKYYYDMIHPNQKKYKNTIN